MEDESNDNIEPDEYRMIETVKHARRTWSLVCQEEKLDLPLLDKIFAALCSPAAMPAGIIEELRAKQEKVFRRFAMKQTEFLAISENDQLLMLSKNTQLFVQYLIGRAVSESDVQQQLKWLMLSDEPVDIPSGYQGMLRRVSLGDLQPHVDDSTYVDYHQYVSKLGDLRLLPCTGNVALVCLFQTDSIYSVLENPGEIRARQSFIYACADWAHNIFNSAGKGDLVKIMEHLQAMTAKAENMNLVADCERIMSNPEMALLMAREEEEFWIKEKLDIFDKALHQISFGADFVKECVMYSLGVPLSKHFIPQGTRVWIERFRTILYSHEEFVSGMTRDEQSEALVPATFAAFALTKAKLETCKSGNEQFKLAFSTTDNAILSEAFALRSGTPRLKRVSIKEWNKTSGLMSPQDEDRLFKIVADLSDLIISDEAFKLLTFLAMFTHLSSSAAGGDLMASVAQRYLNALKRRFAITGQESLFEQRVKTALCEVRELSVILQHASDAAMTTIAIK